MERYQRESRGANGWDKRRQPGYTPSRSAAYSRAYRARKKGHKAPLSTIPAAVVLPSPLTVAGIYTTREAAALLGLGVGTVRMAVYSGTLPSHRIGRLHLVSAEAVAEYRRTRLGGQGWDKRRVHPQDSP